MSVRAFMCPLAAVVFVVAAPAWAEVNQDMLDRAASGELTEGKASWWGFDAEDATEALQAAINSGVAKLTVDNVGKPWVVRPLQLASNQEIHFEKGVEVVAKRGEFKGGGDCLFTASNKENITLVGYGATWRMHRSDYDNPELYKKAEWRHTLSIRSSSNVKVYGLTLAESGGDGIYLGTATRGVTNKDIHIKDVVCESNYRQGISVITAENLLIENTVMRNTAGTPPQAGIDFEPNNPDERLVNVVMRDCLSENNNSAGYVLYLRPMSARSEPLSVRFENCRAINNHGVSAGITNNNVPDDAVTGSVVFSNCLLEGSGGAAISVSNNPPSGLAIRFENVTVVNPAAERRSVPPIQLTSRSDADQPVGGIVFDNVRIQDPIERNPMGYLDAAGGLPLEDISGALVLERGDAEETITLSREILDRWMPVIPIKRIPRVSLEGMALEPLTDEAPEKGYGFAHAQLRRAARFALYAVEGDDVRFTLSYQKVGRYSGDTVPVVIEGPSGEQVHSAKALFEAETEIAFTAPETGVYRITADPGKNRIALTRSSHPVNLLGEGGRIGLIHAAGDYVFWVPAGTAEFGVRVAGEGSGEAIRAMLLDPEGHVVEEADNVVSMHQFTVEHAESNAGAAWTVRLAKPTEQR
ncbi:MAG: right-handed parallel beta-helix repeat-containing protein, partial [Candidatus Hydrogenedentes bacterium]|nr:right-handed parallel beta-helix repeat-containing protein [Candidatus Hydrogenedentota bacterium]